MNNNGLLEKTKLAKERYNNSAEDEDITLKTMNNQIEMATTREENNESSNPTGTIISFYGKTAPKGYLICDGTKYNISDYSALADLILKTTGSYGTDEDGKFVVPDLRGEFLRGTRTNSHANQGSGEIVGTHQDATILPGFWSYNGGRNFQFYPDKSITGYENTDKTIGKVLESGGFFEISGTFNSYNLAVKSKHTSRPTNTSVLYCIKY